VAPPTDDLVRGVSRDRTRERAAGGDPRQLVGGADCSIIVGGILAGIGIFVGLLLLIVPGLLLMTWWVLLIPVIVLERRSAGDAFGRSRELVRGYGWGVFGVIVLAILLLIGFAIVLSLVLAPFDDWIRSFLSNVISGTLTAPFIAVTWTILYYRLRAAKEATVGAGAPAPATDPGGGAVT